MPVYEYECNKCHKHFDRDERLSEHGTKRVHCPSCKSTSLRQIFGGIQVKTSKKS